MGTKTYRQLQARLLTGGLERAVNVEFQHPVGAVAQEIPPIGWRPRFPGPTALVGNALRCNALQCNAYVECWMSRLSGGRVARAESNTGERGKRWPWVLGIVAATLVVAGFVVARHYRDTETPVTVQDAVDFFHEEARADPPTAPTSAPATQPTLQAATAEPEDLRLPATGVYVYTTSGYEETDALGGTRHDYPAETTLTVRTGGCGVVVVWQPLQERSEEFEMCLRSNELVVPRYETFHRFFGIDDRREFLCESAVTMTSRSRSDAETTCVSDGITESISISLLPPESVAVGSEQVEATGVVLDMQTSGTANGSGHAEIWISDDGAITRWSEVVESTSESVIGDVTYAETFRLELAERDPTQ